MTLRLILMIPCENLLRIHVNSISSIDLIGICRNRVDVCGDLILLLR